MATRSRVIELTRSALVPALCIAATAYFCYLAVAGPNGALAWREVRTERARVEAERDAVRAAKARLARHVELLDPRHIDPDLADQLVRDKLGVVRPDEVIVPLPRLPEPPKMVEPPA